MQIHVVAYTIAVIIASILVVAPLQGLDAARARTTTRSGQHHRRPAPPLGEAANTLIATGSFNVLDYGAKGDNSTDNTKAFASALAAAATAGGGVVVAPPGLYRFQGSLSVGEGVRLQGSYASVPSHDLRGGARPNDGTILVPLGGRGSEDGAAFITLAQNAHLAGVCVWYAVSPSRDGVGGRFSVVSFSSLFLPFSLSHLPHSFPTRQEQEMVQTPVAYPWSVHLVAANAAVTDVELLGAWQGVNATAAHRHYIARKSGAERSECKGTSVTHKTSSLRSPPHHHPPPPTTHHPTQPHPAETGVQGHPIKTGVFIDSTYDIGRIEDVHFNPWFSSSHPFIEYQLVHGRAFVLGRSDWEYVFNT